MEDPQQEIDIELETPAPDVFIPPSIHHTTLLSGVSYSHFSKVPDSLLRDASQPNGTNPTSSEPRAIGPPCALGVDEAGRGPVLGPMVYGAFYLPIPLSTPLLSSTHHFDDSKVLTATFRSNLMETLCTPSDSSPHFPPDPKSLHDNCGWAVEVMSARDIGANMLKPYGTYNLNAQAMDATISLIQRIYALGVNVKEIYIDTIGSPATYQAKLERVFPTAKITVAKKADSLYPCVSAASVCAKVTRDAALEVLYTAYSNERGDVDMEDAEAQGEMKEKDVEPDWGSGYPWDVRCTSWLKRNMDPVFGWGSECRFSWGTAKDLLEAKGAAAAVSWPVEEDEETMRLTDFFSAEGDSIQKGGDELANWFGQSVSAEVF